MGSRAVFLILFYGSGLQISAFENILHQANVLNTLDVRAESQRPGAAFAVKTTLPEGLRVCTHQECIRISKNWNLISTLVDGADKQVLLIESEKYGWFLAPLHLDKSLFQLKAPFKLRLPSSVRANIENKDQQVAEDRKYNLQLMKTVSDKPWPCAWKNPLSSMEVVSEFGSTRTLPTGETYSHKGLDLRAKSYTPVRSVASGTVLGTDPQVIGGNILTIDHGRGVISRYLHLTKFKVQKDEQVKESQVVALSGATGRVEAPHLHLEMRVRGIPVEPLSTLKLMSRLCDQE